MSLIEEALRRKSQEQGAPTPEAGVIPPGDSDTVQRAVGHPQPKRHHVPWVEVAGVIVVGLLLCGVAGWLLVVGLAQARKTAQASPVSASQPVQKEAGPAPGGASVSTVAEEKPATPPVAVSTAKEELTPTLSEPVPPAVAASSTDDLAGAQEQTAPAAFAEGGAIAQAAEPSPTLPSPSPREPVLWPHLAVSGILQFPDGECSARINGNLVMVGDVVEGATVVAVTRREVVMVYQGETNTLRVGDATR